MRRITFYLAFGVTFTVIVLICVKVDEALSRPFFIAPQLPLEAQ